MTNAKQPTSRTCHVELKQFAVLLRWVLDDENIIFGDIRSVHNISDPLTKQIGRTKFCQQDDILMGCLGLLEYARLPHPGHPSISMCSLSLATVVSNHSIILTLILTQSQAWEGEGIRLG